MNAETPPSVEAYTFEKRRNQTSQNRAARLQGLQKEMPGLQDAFRRQHR
jgi:hypothetical protein